MGFGVSGHHWDYRIDTAHWGSLLSPARDNGSWGGGICWNEPAGILERISLDTHQYWKGMQTDVATEREQRFVRRLEG